MEKIQHYGVRKIFIYPIYLFWILIFILLKSFIKNSLFLQEFLQDFDPQDVPTEVGVGTSVIATPTHIIFTQTGTPSRVDVGTTPALMSTCQNVHEMMWMQSMALHILKHAFLDLPCH
jgi:hypothetical protein